MKKKLFKSNKFQLAQILLWCLQYGEPKKENYSLEELRKRYKFQNIYDYKKLRSCIDLIEDTEHAVENFFEYQLSTNRGNINIGEKHLRLYGILNAIYLQSHAIIEVAEIFKYKDKKKL